MTCASSSTPARSEARRVNSDMKRVFDAHDASSKLDINLHALSQEIGAMQLAADQISDPGYAFLAQQIAKLSQKSFMNIADRRGVVDNQISWWPRISDDELPPP